MTIPTPPIALTIAPTEVITVRAIAFILAVFFCCWLLTAAGHRNDPPDDEENL